MYVPAHFRPDSEAVAQMLADMTVAEVVTATASGLVATLLPMIFLPDRGEHGSLIGHVARNNTQWRLGAIGEALAIVRGPDAYVSPSWYATKAEHGRVVPTWNYATVHVYGEFIAHDDPAWVDDVVRRLTERHEARRPHPWAVDDAPADFITGALRAIVGVEVAVTRIEAKFKFSQNRSAADIAGVIAGLESDGMAAAADAMRSATQGDGKP